MHAGQPQSTRYNTRPTRKQHSQEKAVTLVDTVFHQHKGDTVGCARFLHPTHQALASIAATPQLSNMICNLTHRNWAQQRQQTDPLSTAWPQPQTNPLTRAQQQATACQHRTARTHSANLNGSALLLELCSPQQEPPLIKRWPKQLNKTGCNLTTSCPYQMA